jgi:hypothetical protein
MSSASASFCEGKVRLRVHPEPVSVVRWCVLSASDVVWRETETSADAGRVVLAGCQWHAPVNEPNVFVVKGGPGNVQLEFTTSGADERAAWIDFLSSVAKLPAGTAPLANSASAGAAAVGGTAAAKLSRAAAAKQERAKLDAAIAELIDEASACEDFENCVVYRQYKRLLTLIDAAVSTEQFEEAIKLRHEKKLIDDGHPEIAVKRDSMPTQLVAATAPSTPLAASAVASPAPAAAAASALGGTSSSTATPVVAKPAPKKLTAAERDALWSKLVSKPAGAPANPGKRGSWDSGFTLQAASNADDSSSTSTEEMRPADAGDKGEPLTVSQAAAGGTPSKPKTPAPGAEETTKKKKKKVVKKKKKKTDAGDADGEEKKKKKKKKKEEDKDKPLTKEEKNKRLTEALAKAKKRAVAQAALNSTWGGNKKGSSQLDALFSKVDMGKK